MAEPIKTRETDASVGMDYTAQLRSDITAVVRNATGLHEHLAMPVADAVIDCLRDRFAGEKLYISRKDPDRDARILAEFNGRNLNEICTKYEIHPATFYRIQNRARKRG